VHLLVKRNFDVIKMHGTTIKITVLNLITVAVQLDFLHHVIKIIYSKNKIFDRLVLFAVTGNGWQVSLLGTGCSSSVCTKTIYMVEYL